MRNEMHAVLAVDTLRLRFRRDPHAPEEFRRRWERLKDTIECGSEETGRRLMARWVTHCRLDHNRRLPVLRRRECGIGGNNNRTDKQIRFVRSRSDDRHPDDIIANYIRNGLNETEEAEKWNYAEITDLVGAFCACLNELLEEECVDGFIEIKVRGAHKRIGSEGRAYSAFVILEDTPLDASIGYRVPQSHRCTPDP